MCCVINFISITFALIFRRIEAKTTVIAFSRSLLVNSLSATLFGKNLARILRHKGWSQAELSQKIGVTNANVSHWISGRNLPGGLTIDILCRVLEVEPREFFLVYDESAEPAPNFIVVEKIKLEDIAVAVIKAMGFEPPKRLKKKPNPK